MNDSRLAAVRQQLSQACADAGRVEGQVKLIAVSKFHDPPMIADVLAAGHRFFGESRVQEAHVKWPDLRALFPDVELHLIGSLQQNKAVAAVRTFDVIHSIDRLSLAVRLAVAMDAEDRRPDCLIQVNTGDESHKGGIDVAEAEPFIKECRDILGLPVVGLMCIPPYDADPGPHFRLLRALAHQNGLTELSMGMSADFTVAVQEGATLVRIGTAIFGPRPSKSA